MCGIYGFCGNATERTKENIERLGLLNEARGWDSTGLAVISGQECLIYKKAVNSTKFFSEYSNIKNGDIYKNFEFLTVLGHTRLATHGAVTDLNAHPFRNEDMVFTHNGIVSNFEELQEKYKTQYEVDSQVIGNILQEGDKEAFKNLRGMFTVPFVDMKESDILQVAIHNQVFAFAYKGSELYYSSDIKHLRTVFKGQGFQICNGGNNLLYKFYLINNQEFAIGSEKIEAKAYKPSYVYPQAIYLDAGARYNFRGRDEYLRDTYSDYDDFDGKPQPFPKNKKKKRGVGRYSSSLWNY